VRGVLFDVACIQLLKGAWVTAKGTGPHRATGPETMRT